MDKITKYVINLKRRPDRLERFMKTCPYKDVQIIEAFDGKNSAVQDMIALNSGAALYISNITNTINDGVEMSFELMNNGKAAEKLADYVRVSNKK